MMKTAQDTNTRYYSLIWRWHFYAGLIVAPFLIILSLTGMIYLFNDEINDLIYPDLRFASSQAASKPPSAFLKAIETSYPGSVVTRIYTSTSPERTAELFVTTKSGEDIRVFIDPPTAEVLGSYVYTESLVGFADVMHGSLLLGDIGDAVVEIAACWTLIMIMTGAYLWFPRSVSKLGSFWPNFSLRKRKLWKNIHMIMGLYAAFFIVFLILSGLPWATVWGDSVLTPVSNALGLGYPDGARRPLGSNGSMHAAHDDMHDDVPWTLQQAPQPHSMQHGNPPISIDKATEILQAAGMASAYRLTLPRRETDTFMALTYPNRPEGQRTLHIDQYSGEILGDVRFASYGAIGKVVEWGVAIHMGNYFGRFNQIIMLIPCIAIIGLITTGIVMWWKRKPANGFSAPKTSTPVNISPKFKAAIIMFGILFPLTGLTFIVIWLIEKCVNYKKRGGFQLNQKRQA